MSVAATESATVSVSEAARVLGVCEKTAYRAVARGDLPAVKLGRRILVSRRRLAALLDGEPEPEPAGDTF